MKVMLAELGDSDIRSPQLRLHDFRVQLACNPEANGSAAAPAARCGNRLRESFIDSSGVISQSALRTQAAWA
jgi:hypothetical protein